MTDSFNTHKTVELAGESVTIASLPALAEQGLSITHLPYSLRILLENLLRREDEGALPLARLDLHPLHDEPVIF